MLLLSQLEAGLRRLFAAVNKCPDRLLTAEVQVFLLLTQTAITMLTIVCGYLKVLRAGDAEC
jgi:hypothetical protein